MRQIYNAESPPPRPISSSAVVCSSSMYNGITSASSNTVIVVADSSVVSASTTPADNQQHILTNATGQSDLLQCITDCANASRLSLANLFPSRFEYYLHYR